MMKAELPEPANVFYRIKRGLAGYISYLAACEMNQAFSEYVLYEPTLRIFTARRYKVSCEHACDGLSAVAGDKKRIDFYARGHGKRLAVEMKWAKKSKVDVRKDHQKLAWILEKRGRVRSFLCLFGRKSVIEHADLIGGNYPGKFRELGKAVFADLRKTRYGCRIYELRT